MRPSRHLLASLLISLFVAAGAANPRVRDDAYDKLVSEGRVLLASAPFDAFMKGASALAIKADGWEAAWLCGDAQAAQGLTDSAREFYNQAKKNAPPEKAAEIQKSLDGSLAASPSTLAQDAEDALSQGLKGKAARLFAIAFRKIPSHPDYGLKAVNLLREMSADPTTALEQISRLCVEVITRYPQSSEASECTRIYAQTLPWRNERYDRYLADAGYAHWRGNTAQCLEYLERAGISKVSGDRRDSRLSTKILAAFVLLDDKRTGEAVDLLKQAVKLGYGFNSDVCRSRALVWLIKREHLPALLDSPAITDYLNDVVGAEELSKLKATLKETSESGGSPQMTGLFMRGPQQPGYVDFHNLLAEAVRTDNVALVQWVANAEPQTYSESDIIGLAAASGAKAVLASLHPRGTATERLAAYNYFVSAARANSTHARAIWEAAETILRPGDLSDPDGDYLYSAYRAYKGGQASSNVIRALVAAGADANSPGRKGAGSSMLVGVAIEDRDTAFLDLALRLGANPFRDIQPKQRAWTLLHSVANVNEQTEPIFKTIFKYKKHRWGLDIRDNDGRTILDIVNGRDHDLANELKKWLKDNPGID